MVFRELTLLRRLNSFFWARCRLCRSTVCGRTQSYPHVGSVAAAEQSDGRPFCNSDQLVTVHEENSGCFQKTQILLLLLLIRFLFCGSFVLPICLNINVAEMTFFFIKLTLTAKQLTGWEIAQGSRVHVWHA